MGHLEKERKREREGKHWCRAAVWALHVFQSVEVVSLGFIVQAC